MGYSLIPLFYCLLKTQIYFLAFFLIFLELFILIEWSVFKIRIKIRRRKIKWVTKTFYGGL
ncbi:hypothetical protein C2S26_06650 [Helicobacter pylori]|nr:hypothetical protein C2S26_06650 [Helicobacter pylori]